MRPDHKSLSAALLLALAACGSSDPAGLTHSVPPRDLCLNLECGTLERLLTIPDAENLLFSDEGRLFVSGGTNVFEITQGTAGLVATPLSGSECNFTGLAIRAATLYAACFDGQLYAAPLSAVSTLAPLGPLGIAAPNGMAVGPDDALYIVNGPLGAARILRVALATDDPLQIAGTDIWLSSGLLAPNGIQADGETFYVTDSPLPALGAVRTVAWTPTGPGTITTLATFPSLPDDLSLLPGDDGISVLAPEFLTGGLRLFGPDGALINALPALQLQSPSQARRGQPPLFSGDEIVITEKGILGDAGSAIGNRLTVLRRR